MTILHHGFQIPDHDAIYSRMNLISTVPLAVNSQGELSSTIQNLDQTMESVSNVLSKHTRNIDCWLSTQDKCKSKRKRQEVLLPFDRGPPIEYQNNLFISSSPAIDSVQQTLQNNENPNPITNNQNNSLEESLQNADDINDGQIIDKDVDIDIHELQDEPELDNDKIIQNEDNTSEITNGDEIHSKNESYSEYENDIEEEEEEAKELEKQKPQKSSRETTKNAYFDSQKLEAARRLKSLLKTRNISPEPATYDPNFEAVLPTINVPQLPPRDKNNSISQSSPKNQKQVELISSTEVLGMYNTKLRDFDPSNVHIRNFTDLYIRYPNEEKNVYDYVYSPKPKAEVSGQSPQLSGSESASSLSENNNLKSETISNSKSKSKMSNFNLSTNQFKKSGNNPKKLKKSKQFKKPNLINVEKSENYILRPTSTLDSKVPRDEIYRNYSAAKHLGPGQYNLPKPQPPVVLNMSNLHDRDCLPTKKGSPRIYPLAVEQADNLRPKKPFHQFSTDTSRETKVIKNRRIQMLDKFKKEKQDLINEICKKSSLMSAKISSIASSKNSSTNDFDDEDQDSDNLSCKRKISISEFAEDNINSNVNRRSKSALKKRTPFDIQSTRPSLLPGEKSYANDPEPVYPFDPIESFKKLQPEPKYVTIRSKPKPLSDVNFWKSTWYGT